MQRRRDQRLARAGRRVEDDVLPVEQREDGLLLRRVERQAVRLDVIEKPVEQIAAGRIPFGQPVGQSG